MTCNAKAFDMAPKKSSPPYPYDKRTSTITLPSDVDNELFHLAVDRDRVEAIKRVMELTGAGLKVSKDYVDALIRRR